MISRQDYSRIVAAGKLVSNAEETMSNKEAT